MISKTLNSSAICGWNLNQWQFTRLQRQTSWRKSFRCYTSLMFWFMTNVDKHIKQNSKSVTTVNCFSFKLEIKNSSLSHLFQQGPWQAWQRLQSPSPRPAATTNPCLRLFPGPLIMRVNGVPHLPMQGNEGQSGVPPPPDLPRPRPPTPGDRPPWPTVGGGSDLTTPHHTAPRHMRCRVNRVWHHSKAKYCGESPCDPAAPSWTMI